MAIDYEPPKFPDKAEVYVMKDREPDTIEKLEELGECIINLADGIGKIIISQKKDDDVDKDTNKK